MAWHRAVGEIIRCWGSMFILFGMASALALFLLILLMVSNLITFFKQCRKRLNPLK